MRFGRGANANRQELGVPGGFARDLAGVRVAVGAGPAQEHLIVLAVRKKRNRLVADVSSRRLRGYGHCSAVKTIRLAVRHKGIGRFAVNLRQDSFRKRISILLRSKSEGYYKNHRE